MQKLKKQLDVKGIAIFNDNRKESVVGFNEERLKVDLDCEYWVLEECSII